jgi:hypothetical protein
MARGDVVSVIASVAYQTFWDYQPAAGVEVMITSIGSDGWTGTTPNKTPYVDVYLYNGSIQSAHFISGEGTIWSKPIKIFITNSLYLRLKNADGASRNLSFCGIQTK